MKSVLSFCCLVVMTLITAPTSFADVARPKPTPLKEDRIVLHTSLEIVPDAKASEARLQIRQSDLQLLRAALNDTPGNTSIAASIAHSSSRTIVAGLLLFFSLSFAGVWLARSARAASGLGRGQKAIAVVLLAVATLGAAAIITRGNAGPPGYYRWRNLPQALSQGQATTGGLDIEIVDSSTGSGMKLIIPLRKQDGPGEE